MANPDHDWLPSYLDVPDPGPSGRVQTRGYVRNALALFQWNSASLSQPHRPHWSLVLIRSGHVVLTLVGPQSRALEVATEISAMVDWNLGAAQIDHDVRVAAKALMSRYEDALQLELAIMFDREYSTWVACYLWSNAYLA